MLIAASPCVGNISQCVRVLPWGLCVVSGCTHQSSIIMYASCLYEGHMASSTVGLVICWAVCRSSSSLLVAIQRGSVVRSVSVVRDRHYWPVPGPRLRLSLTYHICVYVKSRVVLVSVLRVRHFEASACCPACSCARSGWLGSGSGRGRDQAFSL